MDERTRRLEDRWQWPVLIASLLVIPIIVIEQAHVSDTWKTVGDVLNWASWIVFAAELVTFLAVVPEKGAWLRKHPLDVAIVFLTPPFLPASLQTLRLFRLLRLLRLVTAAQMARRLFSLEGLLDATVIAIVTLFAGGAAFAAAEKGHSTWDGIWWSVTTMTTVGYGDLEPRTTLGRLIGIVVMLVGIGFIALVTGAIAQRFLTVTIETETDTIENEVARDISLARADLLRELRTIRARLQELEDAVARS